MAQKVLLVGPLPPKYGGTTISFQLFCEFVMAHKAEGQTIRILDSNTGDKSSVSWLSTRTSLELIVFTAKLLARSITSDKIVIFGSQRFITIVGSLVVLLFGSFGKPVYLRIFGGGYDEYYRRGNWLLQWLVRNILPRANRIVVQTEFVSSRMSDVWEGVVSSVTNYRRVSAGSRAKKRPSADHVSYMYAGLVRKLKGCNELLDAFVELLRRVREENLHIKLQLDLYGEVVSSDGEPLDLTPYAGIPEIRIAGFVDSEVLQQKYLSADVFVFPTRWPTEGHSGSVVEAMMHGLPVVATDWRAMSELITPGVNGLLCRPADRKDLADKLFRLAVDPKLRQSLSVAALRESAKYDADVILPRLCNLLDLQLVRPAL